MTTKTTFPKPRWALTLWVAEGSILVEMPTAYDEPYYLKYPLTEGGLSKALNLLKFQHRECTRRGPRTIKNNAGDVLGTKHPIKRPITAGTTQENRDRIKEILKKRGLI